MNYQRMNMQKASRGLRVVLTSVLMIVLMLCTLAIAASAAETDVSVTVDNLKVNLALRGDGVYTKVYDGVTEADVEVKTQPDFGNDDVTLEIESATFDGVNVGETSAIVVTFRLAGADAAKYETPAPVRIPVVIEKKTVTWNANGTATAPYVAGGTLYEDLAVTLPRVDQLEGVLASDLAGITLNGTYTVSVNATGAGTVQAEVFVDIGNENYVLEPLTVDITITKALLTSITWSVDDFSFLYADIAAYELTAVGYDAAGNVYQMIVTYPNGYGLASETPYLVTATPADTANVDLGTAMNSKEVKISPAVFTVWMDGATYVGDGTSRFELAVGGTIPAEIRDLITYTNKATGAPFAPTAAYGKYTVVASLPQSTNFVFVDKDGAPVTSLEATLCVNKSVTVSTGPDGDAYNIIVVGEDGFSADIVANLSIPESLGKSIRGFRVHKAYSLTMSNVTASDRFTLLISTYEELLNKHCDPLSANDLYIYEPSTGELVPASSKYTVTLKDGYYSVEGYAGDATTTFVIAPQYHTPFLLTAPGIALLILLVLVLIVVLFFAGLYLRRVTRGTNDEQTIDTEGEVPEVVETEAEDVAAEDALDALADELAETIDAEPEGEDVSAEVEAEKAAALAQMLDEASKETLDDDSTVAEDYADAKAEELADGIEAEVEETEADEDALQAAVAAAMADAVNESADAEDAVVIVAEEPAEDEESDEDHFCEIVEAIVCGAMTRTMVLPIAEEAEETVAEEISEEAPAVEETVEETVEEAVDETAEATVEETEIAEPVEEAVAEDVTEASVEDAVEVKVEAVEEAEDVSAVVANAVAEAFELLIADGVEPKAVEGTTLETITDAVDAAAAEAVPEDWSEELTAEVKAAVVDELAARLLVEEAPAVEAFAVVDEESDDDDDNDDDDDDSFGGFGGFGDLKLRYIDVKAEPEEYAALLEQEAAGEIRIVYRLKKSFQSRVIQSQGNVQAYYSAIKNALLSYKGNKNRISWNYEAFNKGRIHVAKVNAKLKTLYLYLALDPEELADTKYGIVDVSSKKKYATVPVLMKIKGDRKFKYALELIDKLCGEELQLPKLEIEPTDYTMPYRSTEELIEDGTIKKLAAGVPIAYFEEQEASAEEATEATVEAPAAEPAIEAVPATEFAVETSAEALAEETETTEG